MKTAKQLGLTKSQHRNLAKLTIFVRDKVAPPKFDINSFFSEKIGDGRGKHEHGFRTTCPSKERYVCSTSACFLGYGPLAGIKAKMKDSWTTYGDSKFGAEMGSYGRNDIYRFLFDVEHENSKMAAVKRGAYLLMNGFPDTEDLCVWEAPRSFKPDWQSIEKLAE